MHMQLDEQFIIDGHGSKQAVIIPFPNYLRLLSIIKRYGEPVTTNNVSNVWDTPKGHHSTVKAWLVSDTHQQYPTGNAKQIDQTIQAIRDDWGDE